MRKVNLGCGDDYRPGWTNVDVDRSVDPDLTMDLERDSWTLEADKYSLALADNVFEHINPRARVNFLSETHRILEEGGLLIMRLPTPGYGVGWDVTHYGVPAFDWFNHPSHRDHWEVDSVTTSPLTIGSVIPDVVRRGLLSMGVRTTEQVTIEVAAVGDGYE